MKLEEKDLLLKDLCARLPYKPMVHAQWIYHETDGSKKHKEADRPLEINDFYAIWNVKPYLRSLSSMTEEEKEEFKARYFDLDESCEIDKDGDITFIGDNDFITSSDLEIYFDFCNSHHFDYRGLIEKGLALEAPEGMYKTE